MAEPNKADERRLEDLRAGNKVRYERLLAGGHALDQDTMLGLQVQAMRQALIDEDPSFATRYGIAYQLLMGQVLDQVEGNLVRRTLTDGTPAARPAPSLTVVGDPDPEAAINNGHLRPDEA